MTWSRLAVLFLALFIIASYATEVLVPDLNPDCPRPLFWSGGNGWDWSTPGNWEGIYNETSSFAPKEFNQVFLEEGNYTTLEGNVSVSSLFVGPHHKLKVVGKLTLNNIELHCWGVNWCSNHGVCEDINKCACDSGWSGVDCSEKICDDGVDKSLCGICSNEPGGDQDICHCSEYLGREPQDVERILLIDTNKALIQDIDHLIELIHNLKALTLDYDPNSLILQSEIEAYLSYLQHFETSNLQKFILDNQNFLALLLSAPVGHRGLLERV